MEYKRRDLVGKPSEDIDCLRCGMCCVRNRPRLDGEDLDHIARGLGMNTSNFILQYTEPALRERSGYWLGSNGDGCTFLSWDAGGDESQCMIYPFRPRACREFNPSLSRPECREGLAKLKARRREILLKQKYQLINGR